MADKCYCCDKELKEVKEVYKEKAGEKTIIIKNTPMSYCNNCNEYFINANVSDEIERIVKFIEQQKTDDKVLYLDNELIVVDYENNIK